MGRWLWPQRPWWAAHGLGAGPVRRAEEAPSLCGQDPAQPPNAQPTMRYVKLGPGQSQAGDGVWAHREALSPGGPCRVQGAGLATLAVHRVPGWELASSGPRGEALAGGAERRLEPPWSASDTAGL